MTSRGGKGVASARRHEHLAVQKEINSILTCHCTKTTVPIKSASKTMHQHTMDQITAEIKVYHVMVPITVEIGSYDLMGHVMDVIDPMTLAIGLYGLMGYRYEIVLNIFVELYECELLNQNYYCTVVPPTTALIDDPTHRPPPRIILLFIGIIFGIIFRIIFGEGAFINEILNANIFEFEFENGLLDENDYNCDIFNEPHYPPLVAAPIPTPAPPYKIEFNNTGVKLGKNFIVEYEYDIEYNKHNNVSNMTIGFIENLYFFIFSSFGCVVLIPTYKNNTQHNIHQNEQLERDMINQLVQILFILLNILYQMISFLQVVEAAVVSKTFVVFVMQCGMVSLFIFGEMASAIDILIEMALLGTFIDTFTIDLDRIDTNSTKIIKIGRINANSSNTSMIASGSCDSGGGPSSFGFFQCLFILL